MNHEPKQDILPCNCSRNAMLTYLKLKYPESMIDTIAAIDSSFTKHQLLKFFAWPEEFNLNIHCAKIFEIKKDLTETDYAIVYIKDLNIAIKLEYLEVYNLVKEIKRQCLA